MWRIEEVFVLFLIVTGFPVSHADSDPLVFVGQDEQFLNHQLDDFEKNAILFQDVKDSPEKEVLIQAGENIEEAVLLHSKAGDAQGTEDEGSRTKKRTRRQSLRTQSLLDSVSQECDGITLRWNLPNMPYSPNYQTSNSEFSHYNIYRETNYFSTITGLSPLLSGKYHKELQKIQTDKWTDRLPPTGTGLFYAVTVVDHNGKETSIVVPKQISFFGSIDKTGVDPTRIIPNLIKGDILHHSLAFNNIDNQYMVAFDLDINKDGRPDHVFALRVNGAGQIIGSKILNATVGIASTEQGHPSVAFNPITRQYLIAFQISAPILLGGVSIIVGQRVLAHTTDRFNNPYLILKGQGAGGVPAHTLEPKIIYNSGNGGFAMAAMIIGPPKTALAVVMKPDGTALAIQRLFQHQVFDVNLFMDKKARQVYFIFQIQQQQATVTRGHQNMLKSYTYLIAATKINATGGLLTLNDPNTVRHLVGFTRERHANIAGYYHENNGWLTVFWNNEENGKKLINSSNLIGVPGVFLREVNRHSCPTRNPVHNPASCFLPSNNGHVLLWEEGSRVGGFLVKDDTFHPSLGEQRHPQLVYNPQQRSAFAVWQQKFGGNFVLFVRNVRPGSQFSCRTPCKLTEKCAMMDVCAPRIPVVSKYAPTCATNNGDCSHKCLSILGGRRCSCPTSHVLASDGMKCFLKDSKPDVSLLYSSEGSIWSVSVYHNEKRTAFTKIPIQGQHIISFFYNQKDKYLYWSDSRTQTINRAHLDGSKKVELINSQVIVPDGMVVDSKEKHIFWTDMALSSIFRCSLDGNSRATFMSGLDKPRALALHQANKWLYWSNWGAVSKIERVNLDGSYRRVIIPSGLGWPNGLTLDGTHLYWADAKLDKIEMSDLNGFGRRVITSTAVFHPYGLGIAGNTLYWTDWAGDIRSVDKTLTSPSTDIIAVGLVKPFNLQVYNGLEAITATSCTDLGVPTFGGRNPPPVSGGKYKIGDRVIFTCNPGFAHLGSSERRCLATGKWDGTDAQCIDFPVFTIRPQNKTVDVGSIVECHCAATSKAGAKPTIKWLKNGKTLQPSLRYVYLKNTRSFLIMDVVVDDTGLYTCVATNDAGNVQALMSVHVQSRPSVAGCGKLKLTVSAKISGGTRARIGSIPWQIMLWDKIRNKPFCGGSLLNAKWGITAAHCFLSYQSADIEVRLGEHDWRFKKKREQYLSVDAIHIHPQYSSISRSYDSDIALIRFKTSAIINDYVIPICLPMTQSDQALLQPGTKGHVSGWGARHKNMEKKGRMVGILHQVEVPIIAQLDCENNHKKYGVTPNMICAGLLNGRGDSCKGDSGGPLSIQNTASGKEILVGIVSWGEKCGTKNKYGVYTKVQNYLNWITSHIKRV